MQYRCTVYKVNGGEDVSLLTKRVILPQLHESYEQSGDLRDLH